MTSVVEDAGSLDTALLARQLRLMEENERRALQRSRAMLLLACCLGELALVLSLGAAVWSKRYEVGSASSRPSTGVWVSHVDAFQFQILCRVLALESIEMRLSCESPTLIHIRTIRNDTTQHRSSLPPSRT